MKNIEVAVGLLWRRGRVLAAQRPEGKAHEGYWEFPGGKLEEGESPQEALTRELAEELGIGVRACRFWRETSHVYEKYGIRVRLHFFHVTAFAGEPCAREGQNMRWVTPAEAAELPLLPADIELVASLPPNGPEEEVA